ncbi:hypothetical protein ACQKP0_13200 [Heyndrickxia sp. NPDC080065]|uniref:hypothetical protein n=1 Tax=Heyndrickxia sp. NPDC080065 TaxID=3390568 RepID=UPI003D089537
MSIPLEKIEVDDIPWQRLTTPYGRGSDLPRLMEKGQYDEIQELIEHQGTLWQVTPWVLLFLLRELKRKQAEEVTLAELQLYCFVADSLIGRELDSISHVEQLGLLLEESYLWPSTDEEDELIWEEEEPRGYTELPFSSYYYYSALLLKDAIPYFERLRVENTALTIQVLELLAKLECLD